MEQINSVFIIGNKRSGSTHLMRLLNLHPEIFVSNETDVIWILYHFHNNIPLRPYPHDSPTGMNESLRLIGAILDKNKSVHENYVEFQKLVMDQGFLSGGKFDKPNLKYLGDQKPYQNADPLIVPFILDNFPNTKFIHLVRHPFLVTASSKVFLKGHNDIWSGLTDLELLDKWLMHEKNVIQAKNKYNIDVIRISYSSLISKPDHIMKEIYQFLELEFNKELLLQCKKITKKNYKPIKNLPLSEEMRNLLDEYGFKQSFGKYESQYKPLFYKYYSKLLNKLGSKI